VKTSVLATFIPLTVGREVQAVQMYVDNNASGTDKDKARDIQDKKLNEEGIGCAEQS